MSEVEQADVKAAEEVAEQPAGQPAEVKPSGMQVKAKLAELGLDKFDSVEKLGQAYLEAEKRFHSSRLPKDANEETLLEKTKEFYNKLESKSVLEGHLGEWSKELAAETGLPAQMVDLITAKVANKALEREASAAKSNVNTILEDSARLAKIQAAVDQKGQWYEDELNERLKQGHVSVGELKQLEAIGADLIESGQSIETQKTEVSANPEAELMSILTNQNHPYYHGDEAAEAKVARLKKQVGAL